MNTKRRAASFLLGVLLGRARAHPATPTPADRRQPLRLPRRDPLPARLRRPSRRRPQTGPDAALCVSLGVYTVIPGDTVGDRRALPVTVKALLATNPRFTDRRLIHVGDGSWSPPGLAARVPNVPIGGIGSAVIDGVIGAADRTAPAASTSS